MPDFPLMIQHSIHTCWSAEVIFPLGYQGRTLSSWKTFIYFVFLVCSLSFPKVFYLHILECQNSFRWGFFKKVFGIKGNHTVNLCFSVQFSHYIFHIFGPKDGLFDPILNLDENLSVTATRTGHCCETWTARKMQARPLNTASLHT